MEEQGKALPDDFPFFQADVSCIIEAERAAFIAAHRKKGQIGKDIGRFTFAGRQGRKVQGMEATEVVCGILKTEKGYLIGKRKSGVHDGIWEFPGGKVEPDESREQALVREWKEELSLKIEVLRELCVIEDRRKDEVLRVHALLCRYIEGEVQLNAHHEIRFVQPHELYSYTFEEADKAILDALHEQQGHLV